MLKKPEKKQSEQKKQPSWKKRGVLAIISRQDNSDVLGSYTGTPKDGVTPVQDADDL